MEIAKEKEVGLSDAIAYVIMKRVDADGIYSFDRDFDRLNIRRFEE